MPLPLTAELFDKGFDSLRALGDCAAISLDGFSIELRIDTPPHELICQFERTGCEQHMVFHGIAMRPGKPILFAVLPDGRPFFGLPGNPVAALVGFRFFVLAAIRQLVGIDRELGRPIAAPQPPREGITQFLRARIAGDGSIVLSDDQRSHVMRSLIDSDHWVCLDGTGPEATATIFRQSPSLAE